MYSNPNAIRAKAKINCKGNMRLNWSWIDPVHKVKTEKCCLPSELLEYLRKRYPSKTIIFDYYYGRKPRW